MNITEKKAARIFEHFIFGIIILIFLYISIRNLDVGTVANADEARHGISAYEMLQTGNWIENTFNYEKDLWNLKPPMSFWAEAVSMRIFGYSIWAFRLPSVIAFITMFFVICEFIIKKYNKLTCIFFMVLFIAFDDFFFTHFGRSGDADAIYGLFYILSLLCLYEYGSIGGSTNKLYLSAFFASMAFLAKSFHAVVLFLIIFFYLFSTLKSNPLKWKTIFIAAVCAFLPIALWAAWRYSYDGMTFLGTMFSTDVTERIDRYNKNPIEYAKWLGTIVFYWMPRMYVAVLGTSLFVLARERGFQKKEKNAILFWSLSLGISMITYVFSFAKANWYFIPFKIILCMSASITMGKAMPTIMNELTGKRGFKIKRVLYVAVVLLWVAILGYSSLNIGRNIKKVDMLKLDAIQTALRDLPGNGRNTEYGGLDAYIYKPEVSEGLPEYWESADILVAELYNDYHCKEGGISAFLNSNRSVLYIPIEEKNKNTRLSDCNVVAENGNYAVLFNSTKND